jgi:hypothetical protein
MSRWAVCIPRSSLSTLAALRLLSDVVACATSDSIWLSGDDSLRENDELRLRQIPGAQRYQVTDDDELIPLGARLPMGRLPVEQWIALGSLLVPQLVTQELPRFPPAKEALVLVRDDRERRTAGILCGLNAFAVYAETASELRLSRLRFIANTDGNVLVIGTPLPPLEGLRYWEDSGIFVAAGYDWQPSVEACVVRQTFGLNDDELAIWAGHGHWDRASRSQFVSARRAAVRASTRRCAERRMDSLPKDR